MHKARKERAEIMEKQKKTAQKTKTSSSFNPASSGKNEPIYYSPSNMQGTGLWCQPTSSRPLDSIPEVPPGPEVFTKDVEYKLSQDLASMLEKKCSELGRKVDAEAFARSQAESKLRTFEGQMGVIQNELGKYKSLCDELKAQKDELEKVMDENCIHYNYTETQIISLQKELDNEKDKTEALKRMQEEQVRLKEEEFEEYQHEINYLRQTIDGLNDENNGLKEYLSHVQQENEKLIEEKESLGQKIVNETGLNKTKEEKAKAKTTKINILSGENKALNQKVKEAEDGKKRTLETNKKLEEENKALKHEVELMKNRIKSEQDMRRHQIDLVAQRDGRIRIYEDKIKKLEEQLEILGKPAKEEEKEKSKPRLVKVKADPEIFKD